MEYCFTLSEYFNSSSNLCLGLHSFDVQPGNNFVCEYAIRRAFSAEICPSFTVCMQHHIKLCVVINFLKILDNIVKFLNALLSQHYDKLSFVDWLGTICFAHGKVFSYHLWHFDISQNQSDPVQCLSLSLNISLVMVYHLICTYGAS